MNLVDIVILLLLAVSAFAGFRSGLIRCVFSLAGLLAGIVIASWNYKHVAAQFPVVAQSQALTDAIWFCVIAIVVIFIGRFRRTRSRESRRARLNGAFTSRANVRRREAASRSAGRRIARARRRA